VTAAAKRIVDVVQWQGCYDEGWSDLIVPEAYGHPAKFSRGLIERIIEHGLAKGYWQPGSTLVDPFGGVALGGIIAGYHGLNWIGVELESEFQREGTEYECPGIGKADWVRYYNRFRKHPDICPQCHATAQDWYEKNSSMIPQGEPHHYIGNLELHRAKWKALGYDVDVRLVQGDSRNLSAIVRQTSGIVTSPPYSESMQAGNKQEGYAEARARGAGLSKPAASGQLATAFQNYGSAPGQIGRLKPGEVDAVLTSPPYADAIGKAQHEGDQEKYRKRQQAYNDKHPEYHRPSPASYSTDPGNIGNLKEGDIQGVITSPPWEDQEPSHCASDKPYNKKLADAGVFCGRVVDSEYGQSDGQIGNSTGGDYWHAVRHVYAQCHQILKPGGVLCVVVKSYVKHGKIVDLPGDTLKLLVHLGFEPVEIVHAMLTKEWQENMLFEGPVTRTKSRKSFFRRLTEKRGSPKIDWECVLFVRKMGVVGGSIR